MSLLTLLSGWPLPLALPVVLVATWVPAPAGGSLLAAGMAFGLALLALLLLLLLLRLDGASAAAIVAAGHGGARHARGCHRLRPSRSRPKAEKRACSSVAMHGRKGAMAAAQAAMQTPRPALQAMMAAGTPAPAVTVPMMEPALGRWMHGAVAAKASLQPKARSAC